MIPIVTPAEMVEIDAAATVPTTALIDRAGAAVAWAARRYLGGMYGARIAVIAGQGNNGADGRVAARRLREWGALVVEFEPDVGRIPSGFSLVVDAAYGTGLSRAYSPPTVEAPVLAVDIPSGVDGCTGAVLGGALRADVTITFQALKPGLVFHPGAALVGRLNMVDLGLDVSQSRCHLLEASDVARLMPRRSPDDHKWRSGCWVIAGSPGMSGAADLAAAAAARAGASYVRLSVPGGQADRVLEAVGFALPGAGWGGHLTDTGRFAAMVVGPGLGRASATMAGVLDAVAHDTPVVIDGDALAAVAGSFGALATRTTPAILTPHDGEFETLTGSKPGPNRLDAARRLAGEAGAVVLLKGPATVVAAPDGEIIVTNTGDSRLATAGTGDILAGIIGALLARGLRPLDAAAVGAWLHGRAAGRAPRQGMIASDLLHSLPEVLDETYVG